MMRHLRQAAALLILAGVGVMIWRVILLPILNYEGALVDQAASMQRQLAEQRATIARGVQIQIQLKKVTAALLADRRWLPPGSPTEVSTKFQQNLQQILVQAGAQIQSLQILPPKVDNGMLTFVVRVDMSIPADKIVDLFRHLQMSQTPAVQVDRIDIQPVNLAMNNIGLSGQRLSVRADVMTYQWQASR